MDGIIKAKKSDGSTIEINTSDKVCSKIGLKSGTRTIYTINGEHYGSGTFIGVAPLKIGVRIISSVAWFELDSNEGVVFPLITQDSFVFGEQAMSPN